MNKRLPWILALASSLFWYACYGGHLWDDAFITFRFSDNWARYGQLTWNPGEPPVEGSTTFLFTLLGAALQRLTGLRPHLIVPWFSLACWAILIALALPALLRRLLPGDPRAQAWLLAAACANASLAFHFHHGMETSLHILTCALALVLAAPDRPISRARALGLSLLTVQGVLNRPDAAIFLGVVWLVALVQHRRQTGLLLAAGAARASLLASVVLWKAQHFGAWVPNTFLIKSGSGWNGLGYVAYFMLFCLPLLAVAAAGAWRNGRPDRWLWICLLPALVQALAFTRPNPILGGAFRFLIALWLPFFLAGARGLALLPGLRCRQLARLVLCGAALLGTLRMAKQAERWRDYAAGCQTLARVGQVLEAARHLEPPPRLGTGDVGAMPYFSGLPTFDLIGLCSAEVARGGLTHALLDAQRPDLLILQDVYVLAAGESSPLRVPFEGGAELPVDLSRYAHLPADPSRHHYGDGADMMVLTWPAFRRDYRFARRFAANHAEYWIFQRQDYVHADALARILARLPEPATPPTP